MQYSFGIKCKNTLSGQLPLCGYNAPYLIAMPGCIPLSWFDIPYSKSTERSMYTGAAPVLPGAPLKASASRLKTELASPGTRLTAERGKPSPPHLLSSPS